MTQPTTEDLYAIHRRLNELEKLFRQDSLNTPLEIYNAATTVFPCARLTKAQDDPLAVDLKLGSRIPVVRLTNAVNRTLFLSVLQGIALKKAIGRIEKNFPAPAPLDPARFSVRVPLSNWQEFQNFWEERDSSPLKNSKEKISNTPLKESNRSNKLWRIAQIVFWVATAVLAAGIVAVSITAKPIAAIFGIPTGLSLAAWSAKKLYDLYKG